MLRQVEDAPLGTAAHGAADVADSGSAASAGKDESSQRGQHGVEAVYLLLHRFHLRGGDDAGLVEFGLPAVGGEVGADDKEVVLHLLHEATVLFVGKVGDEESQVGIEFIDGAVGFQADVGFGHSGAAH